MFCTNIFHQNTSFDPKTSPARNMTLNIGLPLGIENHGLFFRYCIQKIKKGIFLKTMWQSNAIFHRAALSSS